MDDQIKHLMELADKALRLAENVSTRLQGHEDVCEQVRKNNEVAQEHNLEFQGEMRVQMTEWDTRLETWGKRLEDSVQLMRGSLSQAADAQVDRQEKMMSDVNVRISRGQEMIVSSLNISVKNVQDALAVPITANAANLAAFIGLHTEITKGANERFKSLDDRTNGHDKLIVRVSGWSIVTLLAGFVGTFTKLIHLW